jgi:farnesyl-diphosphate farnesyltransferase
MLLMSLGMFFTFHLKTHIPSFFVFILSSLSHILCFSHISHNISSDFDFIYHCLSKFSPSISGVILNLTKEIRDPACVYYLLTYALQIVNDDPDLSTQKKVQIFQSFPTYLQSPDNSLNGIGSTDQERQFLSSFKKIVSFYNKNLPSKYQQILGKFIEKSLNIYVAILTTPTRPTQITTSDQGANIVDRINDIDTVEQYNQRCVLHIGLVFECIDKLFIESGLVLHAAQGVIDTSMLAASAGIFVQKVNLIRSFRKNLFSHRSLWPREIWGLYVQNLDWFVDHSDHIRAKLCINHMVLDALKNGLDSIQYLALIQHHQPTFCFVAVQIVAAYALLAEVCCYPTYVFSTGNVDIRIGLLCDVSLNCKTIAVAKGYIYSSLQKIEHNLIDPELDPVYLQPTVTQEETKKAIAQYQQFTQYLQRSKEFCLGFDSIPSGWETVVKWVGLTAGAALAFKYLTDYNNLWDNEFFLRLNRGHGGRDDVEHFNPKKTGKKRHGYRYQKSDLEIDDYLSPERQLQSLENIMSSGGSVSAEEMEKVLLADPKDQNANLARAEAFLESMLKQGPDVLDSVDFLKELRMIEKELNIDTSSFGNDGFDDDGGIDMTQFKNMLGQIGADPDALTNRSGEFPFAGNSLPPGYIRDMNLSLGKGNVPLRKTDFEEATNFKDMDYMEDESDPFDTLKKMNSGNFNDDKLEKLLALGAQHDDSDSFDILKKFEGGDADLAKLLGIGGSGPIENMEDDKFFDMIAKMMDHGAGKDE